MTHKPHEGPSIGHFANIARVETQKHTHTCQHVNHSHRNYQKKLSLVSQFRFEQNAKRPEIGYKSECH